MSRASGFYRVLPSKGHGWTVGEWDADDRQWCIVGEDSTWWDDDFAAINEQRISMEGL